jgi:hypothetical protein
VERNVHENLLALVHNNEVNVLDDLEYGVLLDILHQSQLALAIDLEVEDCVLLTKKKTNLVSRNRYVLNLCTVTVYNCRNLASSAQTASKTLTELGTYLCGYLVINFSHDGLLICEAVASIVISTRTHVSVRKRREPHSTASITDIQEISLAEVRLYCTGKAVTARNRAKRAIGGRVRLKQRHIP